MLGIHLDAALYRFESGTAQHVLQDSRLVIMQMLEGEPAWGKLLGSHGAGHLQHQVSVRRQCGMETGECRRWIVEMFKHMGKQDQIEIFLAWYGVLFTAKIGLNAKNVFGLGNRRGRWIATAHVPAAVAKMAQHRSRCAAHLIGASRRNGEVLNQG